MPSAHGLWAEVWLAFVSVRSCPAMKPGCTEWALFFAFLGLLVHEFVKDGEEKQKRQLEAYTQANWERFEAKRAADSESGVIPQVPSEQPTPKRPTGG